MMQGTEENTKISNKIVSKLHLKKEATIWKWFAPTGKETENIATSKRMKILFQTNQKQSFKTPPTQ